MKKIKVVAALIQNNENQILICQRPKNKKRSLLWEFVGGKVENNESYYEALIRECKEELDIEIKPERILTKTTYKYPDVIVELIVIKSKITSGIPKKLEHNDIKWVRIDELDNFKFCPADIEIINQIKNSRFS